MKLIVSKKFVKKSLKFEKNKSTPSSLALTIEKKLLTLSDWTSLACKSTNIGVIVVQSYKLQTSTWNRPFDYMALGASFKP